MKGTLLSTGIPHKKHFCPTPGWWKRRRLKIGPGAEWMCNECGMIWTLRRLKQSQHDYWLSN